MVKDKVRGKEHLKSSSCKNENSIYETVKRKRGRPRKTQIVVEDKISVDVVAPIEKKKRGRPKKSSNVEKPISDVKKTAIKDINEDILSEEVQYEESVENVKSMLEQILFKIPSVKDPLIGSPKDVQSKLDNMAKKMQKDPDDSETFNTIHLYMHGYLINMVLKKFPFIVGYQTVDIYQETLIALRFKAIPNFNKNKGMSFLNFAKLCIRRHLITILHASKNRNKDKTMNLAISLDSSPPNNNDDNSNVTYVNIIFDNSDIHDNIVERSEAFEVTKKTLMEHLSDFERVILEEYLSSSSYKEISKDVSRNLSKRYNTKSIDNALLRIRKKAISLLESGKLEEIPLFI